MPQPKVSKQQSTQTAVLRPLQARLTAAKLLYGKIQAAPQAWLTAQARATNGKGGTSTTQAGGNGINLQLLECNSYKDLVNSWRKAMKWIEGLDCALSVMLSSIISVPSVGEQLWCKIISPPSTGKTVLCEALSVNLQYVVAKSTIRGFFSGWKSADGSDTSLFPKIVGRTLVIKDGDTLIRAPNLEQILAEARDIYDGKARTHYRNEREDEYTGRCTIILSGTNSLRRIDSSELGERFLDCVIVEEIDDDLEEEIAWRVANRAVRNISQEATEEISTNYDPPMANAMQLTGGYISYLRENANELLSQITIEESYLRKVVQLGKFVAYLRARPSRIHDEKAQREFCGRLVIQITRLTMCLTAVLNKTKVDNEVMRRVIKVAMDTARGNTLEVVQHLGNADHGMELKALTLLTSAKSDQSVRSLLIFLKQIGVTEVNLARSRNGVKVNGQRWQLTAKMRKLLHNIENTEE